MSHPMGHVLRASPCRRGAVAALIGVLASGNLARADGAGVDPSPRDLGRLHVISPACRAYAVIPADARDERLEWEQRLSFAACLQDGAVDAVGHAVQLEPLLEDLTDRLEIPMLIYVEALATGPSPIQLRAAFHIGWAQLALGTRARSAIAAPPDLATSPEAAERYRALHARLEPLLARSRRAAWISFAAIDDAVARNPALATDDVARHMIRTARELLPGLRDAADPGRRALAAAPRRERRHMACEPASMEDVCSNPRPPSPRTKSP
jgi:hypothetical protein